MDANERKIQLGARIKELRQAQGVSQRRFSMMIGTGRSYLSDIENGRINIGYDLLCRIAEGLGATVGDLADGEVRFGAEEIAADARLPRA